VPLLPCISLTCSALAHVVYYQTRTPACVTLVTALPESIVLHSSRVVAVGNLNALFLGNALLPPTRLSMVSIYPVSTEYCCDEQNSCTKRNVTLCKATTRIEVIVTKLSPLQVSCNVVNPCTKPTSNLHHEALFYGCDGITRYCKHAHECSLDHQSGTLQGTCLAYSTNSIVSLELCTSFVHPSKIPFIKH
jgi:hypothetical protein